MTISGTTRIYAHIGFPIRHTRTAALYNGLLDERGIDLAVVPYEVEPEHLPSAVSGFRAWRNLTGIGVTIPHKESMVGLVDELTPMARLCGATNVIRRDPDGRLVGGQFDGIGLVQSLVDAGHPVADARVLLSGAGGTARAAAFALADSGIRRLEIVNRTRSKAEAIIGEVRDAFPGCEAAVHEGGDDFDIVINTTSLGMQLGDALPVDPAVIGPGVVVVDAVMAPPETEMLALAAARGGIPHPGLLMLRAQFEVTLDFLGVVSR